MAWTSALPANSTKAAAALGWGASLMAAMQSVRTTEPLVASTISRGMPLSTWLVMMSLRTAQEMAASPLPTAAYIMLPLL